MGVLSELLEMKTKEDKLTVSLIVGILILSIGIGIIKLIPPLGSSLIILGSTVLYVSIIALVFTIK